MINKTYHWISRLAFTTLILVICIQTTHALVLDVNKQETHTEYLGITGVLEGRNAPFRILVPDEWNGTLLIYARGTGSIVKLDDNGEPLRDENGFPRLGVTPLTNALPAITNDGLVIGDDPDLFEEELLEQGYALAASDYRPDPRFLEQGLLGWVVEDGIRDISDLTWQAHGILLLTRGLPEKTILWGRSQGSIITLSSIERSNQFLYDGALTGCTVGAGTSRSWDSAIDLALAFDRVFAGVVLPSGERLSPSGAWIWGIGDIDNGVTFGKVDENGEPVGDVLPILLGLLSDPQKNIPRFEFMRLVTRMPLKGFYPFRPSEDIPGFGEFNWLFAVMLFATEVRADLEQKAGGPVGQNKDHVYTLSNTDKDYLEGLGLGDVDSLLKQMNNRTNIGGSKEGRLYTGSYADFTGHINIPVLTLHTTTDGLVLPSQVTEYRQTLEAAGREELLFSLFVDANGHCSFFSEEWLAALDAMNERLNNGDWPKPDSDIFVGVKKRFDFDFDPGPFPQPPE